MLSGNLFHTLLMSSEYISKQCLMLSDNFFPVTFKVAAEVGKPLHKTRNSIRAFIRKKLLVLSENPFQLPPKNFLGAENLKDLTF